jgi:hypothetical protein
VAGLDPASAWGFVVEVEAAVATRPAVMRTGALIGRLGRPGERTLVVGEAGEVADDFVDGAGAHKLVAVFSVRVEWRGVDGVKRIKMWKQVPLTSSN